MKRTYIIVLLCLLGVFTTNAQQITEAEYFFDTDPGVGNGINIPLTPGNSIDMTATADLSALGMGYHSILVRVKDENGVWSVGKFKTIFIKPEAKTGQIIAAEYFFDDDPGIGNGTAIQFTGTDNIDEMLNIPVPEDLEFGPHRLYIRTKSTDNLWSHYAVREFEVCNSSGPIISEQYYEICDGDSILIEGVWQSEASTYIDTLISVFGCDSIVLSYLTVNALPAQPVVEWDGNVLSSTPGFAFQWYLSGIPIDGANEQEYLPTENGYYAVEVFNEEGCSAASEEIQVNITGLEEFEIMLSIQVYPNPTAGEVTLQNLPPGDVIIEVYSSTGKQVFQLHTGNESETINLNQFGKGLYHLRIRKDNQTIVKKIIVN